MSIVWTLRKYIDSIEHREAEAAQRRDRRVARRQGLSTGGEGNAEVQPYACRVCGHRSTDGAYCPHCLAETMVVAGEAPTGEPSR